ncbi:transportin-3-like isoform X1 [Photinus pyralis]|uniref:Transportin-3 n=1 Tax=Photinus pyralis TaxID=7054 RepID=A0A1Y1N445_PHOPY|nr:transportin-3-like isoform X1 [Photinus pyralis]
MEQKPSLDVVLLAISSLYNNPDTSEKERASHWLEDLQKSVHAWTIADELLHLKRDLESCYFAAQTMRTKIQQCFYELPVDAHVSLRDSLLDHISQINEHTDTVIVTQLCVALADLVLQMPNWTQPLYDLINKFSQTNVWPLLEILTVLPEELEGRSVRLGENRRTEILDNLKLCSPTVNEFLKHCCNSFGDDLNGNIQGNIKIIRCFTSWVTVNAISLDSLVDNVIITRVFEVLNQKFDGQKLQPVTGSLHDSATDCVCTILRCLEDNNNHQQVLEMLLFNKVLTLEVPYHLSVANEDQEKSMNYCRIFTELGESFLNRIISNSNRDQQHFTIKVLDLILMCVGHHDYEVAEITFNLWFLLSEELYQRHDYNCTDAFKPYVERLITALCRHSQMEPDHEGLLESGDDFKEFRMKVFELIKDVVFIVGGSNCFRQMFLNLQVPGVTWDASEASLFVMQAVAKSILTDENDIVPKVVEAILNLPENTHVAVKYTSILLLGELCEWIERHPATLDLVLNFLVCCLSQPRIGGASATALQNICAACNDHMPRHIPVLLQLLGQIDTLAIANSAIIGLLKGVTAIVSCMPHNDIPATLRELCLLQTNPLCELMKQNAPTGRGMKTDPVMWLDRLSSIFRNLYVPLAEGETNPCKSTALEVWPVLSHVMEKYQGDVRIMERCCRSIRFMLRCVSQQLSELLQPLISQLVQIYNTHQHSCFLYVGSILVDEYAVDPNCIAGLLEMLKALINPTFNLLQQENGLRNHPDTVDDFFRLCARLLQRAPMEFLQCTALPLILQCSLLACSLDHKEANMSVMKFFNDLISSGHTGKQHPDYDKRKAMIQSILNEYGQQLITNLIHACVFYLHSYMLSEMADVFVELLQLDHEVTSKWLTTALDSLPKQGHGGIVTATPDQLQAIYISITRSDTSKSVTYALKDLTRLYR